MGTMMLQFVENKNPHDISKASVQFLRTNHRGENHGFWGFQIDSINKLKNKVLPLAMDTMMLQFVENKNHHGISKASV